MYGLKLRVFIKVISILLTYNELEVNKKGVGLILKNIQVQSLIVGIVSAITTVIVGHLHLNIYWSAGIIAMIVYLTAFLVKHLGKFKTDNK